jgi:CHAT domain
MTSDPGTPFVSDSFVSIDIGDSLLDVRAVLDLLEPTYLVVNDRTSAHAVFVYDVDTVHTLLDELTDDTDALGWTGALLVRELRVEPSIVVDLARGQALGAAVPRFGLENGLRRRMLVTLDGAVRGVIDTVPSEEESQGSPPPLLPEAAVAEHEGVVNGLQVLLPGEVLYDTVVPLIVLLTRPGGDEPDIRFAAEVGDLISVVVWPQEGVEVVGSDTATVEVSEDGEGETAKVELRITSPTRASVIVEGFQGQTSLGSALVELRVVLGAGPPPATQRAVVLPLERGQAPRSDLAVHVVETRNPTGDGRGLRFVAIEPGHKPMAFPFRSVTGDVRDHLAPLFESINAALDTSGASQPAPMSATDAVVRGIGLTLTSQLLPAGLAELLVDNRKRIRSIVVHSEESLIPWELCLLTHVGDDGRTVEDGFLCELFELTRWRPRLPARDEISMRSIGVIAPGDSGLTSREAELTMLTDLATADRTVTTVPATTDQVMMALTDGSYDVLHFVGHGELPDPDRASSARLVLAGASVLTAEWIGGASANFGLTHPLVFLNACRLGSASAGLVGPSGFARVMLDAGSAVFVGAHWDVVDSTAHQFAAALYRNLVDGQPVGSAALAARLAVRKPGDPTWLAYTVFASPTARVTSS